MIVRCGRCGTELDIAGPGEFMCPSCGTRNVARSQEPVQNPFGVPDLGAAAVPEQAPGVTWVRCPSCSFRFAVGEVEEVPCPSCSTVINLAEQGVGADPV